MLTLIFLSSGLFFGWSLGANDASNMWGTAVSTKMVRFRTAAFLASLFVILGSTLSGEGASHTLGKLGAVNEFAGAFMVVFSAGLTVFWMTKLNLPVSTSQAIVGSIIGWNFFSGMLTDFNVLAKIVTSWITSLILAALFSSLLFIAYKKLLPLLKISIFRLDSYIRIGLIALGAFGSYALGANNIANVMGVFVPISPFRSLRLGPLEFTSTEQLFLIGSIAIAVGIFTYSQRVMATVGEKVVKLTPQTALVVILAAALVQFLFASQGLHNFLVRYHLPALPLVPVSSSQLVIGAVVGIGIAGRNWKNINYRILGRIASGWVTTPVIAAGVTFLCLFFLQNVFDQRVYRKVEYEITEPVVARLNQEGIQLKIEDYEGQYKNILQFHKALTLQNYEKQVADKICTFSEVDPLLISNTNKFRKNVARWFRPAEINSILGLENRTFRHRWQLFEALQASSPVWRLPENATPAQRSAQERKLEYIFNYFRMNQ